MEAEEKKPITQDQMAKICNDMALTLLEVLMEQSEDVCKVHDLSVISVMGGSISLMLMHQCQILRENNPAASDLLVRQVTAAMSVKKEPSSVQIPHRGLIT